MLQSVSKVRSLKLVFIVSPLIVTSFLSLTQHILFITKNRLYIAKGCILKGSVPRKVHLINILKVYVLGLASVVMPKNWLTIKLGGFFKANHYYLNVTQILGLVHHLL